MHKVKKFNTAHQLTEVRVEIRGSRSWAKSLFEMSYYFIIFLYIHYLLIVRLNCYFHSYLKYFNNSN